MVRAIEGVSDADRSVVRTQTETEPNRANAGTSQAPTNGANDDGRSTKTDRISAGLLRRKGIDLSLVIPAKSTMHRPEICPDSVSATVQHLRICLFE